MKNLFVVFFTTVFMISGVSADETVPTLSLTGTGTVEAQPDEGYITIGVETKRETSVEAVRDNTKDMQEVYAVLEQLGIDKENIATVNFSVDQLWRYEKVDDRNNRPVPDGFQVSNIVRITVCDLDSFGEVLDKVTASGANRVQSISFGSSRQQSLLDEARAAAVADALRKAKIISQGLNVNLGMVLSVSESSRGVSPQPVYAARMALSDAAESVPVSGGSLSFSVNVSVVWTLQNAKEHRFPRKADPRMIKGPANVKGKGELP